MKLWLLVDRVSERVMRYYHTRVFLARATHTSGDASDYRILGKVYVNATNITLGKNVTIYPNVYFWGDGEIVIGDNCDIGRDTVIFASKQGGVRIGDDVSVDARCGIIDSNHGIRRGDLIRNQPQDSERILIGNDVWIAAKGTVIKGAKICDGAVVGAGSVVNSEMPAYAIAAGVPAKVIRMRT